MHIRLNQTILFSDSPERFIQEVAKKGVTQPWDSLSPTTVATVTQPWQRSKMLDFAKKQQCSSNELKERFFINDREERKFLGHHRGEIRQMCRQ